MMLKVTDKKYSMNEMLKINLEYLNKAVNAKWDCIILIDGVEGSGKTSFGSQIGYFFSHINKRSFSVRNIVFTAQQFEHAVTTFHPHSTIIWDEAVFGAMATEWASIVNKTITKLLVTIRKRQLFIIIIIPYIFMLQAYLAVGRTRCLLHVHTPDGIKRGYFKFYNYTGKQFLYFKNKKFYTYKGVDPIFIGTFAKSNGFFFDENKYEEKKDLAINDLVSQDSKSKRLQEVLDQRDEAIRMAFKHISAYQLSKNTGISTRHIRAIVRSSRGG